MNHPKCFPVLSLLSFLAIILNSCNPEKVKTIGSIERLDPSLDALINPEAKIEILGEGFEWTEGPLWVKEHKMLLFSDIPPNMIYKWTEEKGVEKYLFPSGFTGDSTDSPEPGSNGLLLNPDGKLVLCQHGDRRMAAMDAPLTDPKPNFITLADRYQGKRLNSPNDAIFDSQGNLYFTDPPYGFAKRTEDPAKEIPFQGVYKLKPDGELILLTDSITRPNGIALSPDEKTLYIANSDPDKAVWYSYFVNSDSISNGKVFYDATENAKTEKGLPDGMKVDNNGNIFASGPGGIWIFNSSGKVLGRILIPEATANCAFDSDGKTLFLTSDMYLLRIHLKGN